MQQLGNDEEEAAITLGAGGWFTFFRVTLPRIRWGLIYGVILCNARAMGEFGAVSVVSGNVRGLTTTMPLQIEILYNEYNFVGAFARGLDVVAARRRHAHHQDAGRSAHGVPAPMKRNSLGWWLAASNVAIVLLVAAGISYFAIDMLRGLADSQQKIRVQLAGANARQEITRMAEDTLTYARVLAERPPLRRLLAEPGARGPGAFPAPLLRDLRARCLRGIRRRAGGGVERRGVAVAAALHDRARSRASVSWRCRPARNSRWSARWPNYRRSTARSA